MARGVSKCSRDCSARGICRGDYLHRRVACFWIGYALFGIAYFVAATGLVSAMEKSGILPTALFSYVHEKLYEPKVVNLTQSEAQGIIEGDVVSGQMPRQDGTIDVVLIRPSRATFVEVGNTVLCIPFGVLGGLVTTAFYRRRLRHTTQKAPPSLS